MRAPLATRSPRFTSQRTLAATRYKSRHSGHLTGRKTIAEWAENAGYVEMLRGLGVD